MGVHPHPAHLGPCRHLRPFISSKSTPRRHTTRCRVGPQHTQDTGPFQRWSTVLLDFRVSSHLQKLGAVVSSFSLAAVLALGCFVSPAPAVTNEQLLFLEAWRAVDRAYYDKNFNGKPWFKIREQFLKERTLADRQETYTAIRALLAQLDDPFTRFLEPSRYAALKRGTAGSLTGVGLEVGFDMDAGTDSPLVVVTPSAGGPADKAGIQPRDAVVAIDGKPTAGTSLYDAGEQLQGPEGTQVTLTVRPHTGGPERDILLSRARLTFNPVSSQVCKRVPWGAAGTADASSEGSDGNLGYIRVATFSKQTTDNVRAALHQLKSEGASRYVLDIRNNGGGLFPAGVDVARMLLDDGDIVLIADSQGVRDSYQANGAAVESSAPLAVLVNKGTASASEVLAGALRDNERGKIVGETTFGKGLIQTIVELSDGSGVAITVARYQTPAGTDINKKGIQPDIAISSGNMPPSSGAGFCKYVASAGAAVFFDADAAASLSSKLPSEDRPGQDGPVDVTLYENAISQAAAESQQSKEPSEPAEPASESSATGAAEPVSGSAVEAVAGQGSTDDASIRGSKE